MSEEWTKGPWFVDDDGDIRGHDPSDPDEPWYVAFVYGGFFRREREANAHLIAAAPDLYEALEAATVDMNARVTELWEPSPLAAARAALSKARGEDNAHRS